VMSANETQSAMRLAPDVSGAAFRPFANMLSFARNKNSAARV
jgi:hypothetical protein